MTTPAHTIPDEDIDAVVLGVETAALWADGMPLPSPEDGPDDPETGDLQWLRLSDDDREILARYVRAFVAAVHPWEWEAALDMGATDGDPLGYIGHTLYLSAAGHGVSFCDCDLGRDTAEVLDAAASRICGAWEHAGFVQVDDENATIDMLAPWPESSWQGDVLDARAWHVPGGPSAWVDADAGDLRFQAAEGAEVEDFLAGSALRARGVPILAVAALEAAQEAARPADADEIDAA